MEHNFWNDRWQAGETGWQQEQTNEQLIQYWPALKLPRSATVFVPLCGSSIDMVWLREQGLNVVGAELNEPAVRRFFEQHDIAHEVTTEAGFTAYRGDHIAIFCGDVFAMTPAVLGDVDAVYDRAATVALPDDLRTQYAELLKQLLPSGASMLLLSLAYDQAQMSGPPFSVPAAEVDRLYASQFSIQRLGDATGPDVLGVLADRGLKEIDEVAYLLKKN